MPAPPLDNTLRPVLGVRVHALTLADLQALVADAIARHQPCLIANYNLHIVHLHHRDATMARFIQSADWVHIDGMPLIWLGRWRGHPWRREHRVTYADWMPVLLEEAQARGWRVAHVGGEPEAQATMREAVRQRWPRLDYHGFHGFFQLGGEQDHALVRQLQELKPHILLAGMGNPRQEQWLALHRAELPATVMLCCGAAMKFLTGMSATPPRWMGRVGLEWLHRLASEPRRLAGRYLIEPWSLLPWILRDLLRR